jgi:hypothetical protein
VLGLLLRVERAIAGRFLPKQLRSGAAADEREWLRDLLNLDSRAALWFASSPDVLWRK